jgi:hypothetical protein
VSNVIDICKKKNDGNYTAPIQALEEAIKCLGKEGEGAFTKGKKLIIICLDDTDGNFHTSFINAQLKMSECIALCETAKQVFLSEMNY